MEKMDGNYFSNRDHIVLISYQDVIKATYPKMLELLTKEYYDDLKDVLMLDKIKDYDYKNLERLCAERTIKNPLEFLSTSEFDTNKLLTTFEKEMIEIYTHTNFTLFGSALYMMFKQPNIKRIYIYNEEPIYQIAYDLKTYFGDEKKAHIVFGEFKHVLENLKDRPTAYFLNDIEMIDTVFELGMQEYCEFAVAELGYNYELDEDNNIKFKGDYFETKNMKEKIYKIGSFSTIKLTDEHFSCLRSEEGE